MWDPRIGDLATLRLHEAHAAAERAALTRSVSAAVPGRLRMRLGVLLLRWGTRLVAVAPTARVPATP